MRPPTNQETMNVYIIRIPEQGDLAKAFQKEKFPDFIISLMFTQQQAKMYRHKRVVEETNMKKCR